MRKDAIVVGGAKIEGIPSYLLSGIRAGLQEVPVANLRGIIRANL